tara:strand:+ start:451 stop:900 length:450 start_codon:yes stop_codon:yes gene_type:complete
MFFNSFMPKPTFSAAGSSSKSKSKLVPKSSPMPKLRPKTLNTGGLSSPKPRTRPSNLGATGSSFGLKAPNDANGVGRRNAPAVAPVNVSADTSKNAAGSTGGASGKVKASKAQEDNVSVRKAARGTSKYQVTKASKNPLVVNKKKTKVV